VRETGSSEENRKGGERGLGNRLGNNPLRVRQRRSKGRGGRRGAWHKRWSYWVQERTQWDIERLVR